MYIPVCVSLEYLDISSTKLTTCHNIAVPSLSNVRVVRFIVLQWSVVCVVCVVLFKRSAAASFNIIYKPRWNIFICSTLNNAHMSRYGVATTNWKSLDTRVIGWMDISWSFFFSLLSCNAQQQMYYDIMFQPFCASYHIFWLLVSFPTMTRSSRYYCILSVVLMRDILDGVALYCSNVSMRAYLSILGCLHCLTRELKCSLTVFPWSYTESL